MLIDEWGFLGGEIPVLQKKHSMRKQIIKLWEYSEWQLSFKAGGVERGEKGFSLGEGRGVFTR